MHLVFFLPFAALVADKTSVFGTVLCCLHLLPLPAQLLSTLTGPCTVAQYFDWAGQKTPGSPESCCTVDWVPIDVDVLDVAKKSGPLMQAIAVHSRKKLVSLLV